MRETAFASHPGGLLPGCRERRPRRDKAARPFGRCKPGVHASDRSDARNRASGFGGDWRVRQQLPVESGLTTGCRQAAGSRRCAGNRTTLQ